MSTVSKVNENLFPYTRDSFEVVAFPEKVAFCGLAIVIFFAPFFNGLFFPDDQRIALMFATILFWLIALAGYLTKSRRFFTNPLEYIALAIPLVYLLATINAANYALSIDELFENILYFMVFWSIARTIHCINDIQKIFGVIITSAVLVSLVGLFTASGWLNIESGFLTSDGGTIASTFQYKNSLASFLIASIFIGIYLNSKLKNTGIRYALSIGNFIMLLVLFSTQSHGGYIIFAIFSVVLWFLTPAEMRLRSIINIVVPGVIALIASRLFLEGIANKAIAQAWIWILGGILLSVIVYYFLDKLSGRGKIPTIPFKYLLIATIVVTLVVCILMSTMGIFQMLYEKLHMFGAMERITMYQDGLKMIKEKPLLGWGGGGWTEAYTMFQGYGYNVRQTHSYFIQLTIETGLIGLAIAIAFWLAFLAKAYKLYKAPINDKELRSLLATLICGILAIISHAVFDFDLSLSALSITMYTLIACVVAIEYGQSANAKGKDKFILYSGWGPKFCILTLMSLLVLGITLTVTSSNNLYKYAVAAIQERDGQHAINYISQAITYNPLQAKNYEVASQLQLAMGQPDKALENAKKAVQMAGYNPNHYANLALAYLRTGQNEQAINEVNKAIELAPLKVSYYEVYSNVLTGAAMNELRTGNLQQAEKYVKKALEIPNKIEKVLASVEQSKKELWFEHSQPLVVTERIKLQLGVAHLLNGNIGEANKYITQAAQNQQIQKDTIIWQALLAKKQGNNKKADDLLEATEKANPNIKKQFQELAKLKTLAN